MKTLTALVALLLLNLNSISQTKLDASGQDKTCVNSADLRTVLKSYELGKLARQKVPLLEQKVLILDSTITLYKQRLESRNQLINEISNQLSEVSKKLNESQELLVHQTDNINKVVAEHAALEKQLSKQKNKHRLITILIGALAAAVAIIK